MTPGRSREKTMPSMVPKNEPMSPPIGKALSMWSGKNMGGRNAGTSAKPSARPYESHRSADWRTSAPHRMAAITGALASPIWCTLTTGPSGTVVSRRANRRASSTLRKTSVARSQEMVSAR